MCTFLFLFDIRNMQQELFDNYPTREEQPSTCPVISKGQTKLTKAQSEFNRLNKKIISLREELGNLSEKQRRINKLYNESLLPLMKEYNALVFKVLCKLDTEYEKAELDEDDLFALSAVILDKCTTFLIDTRGIEEEDKKAILALQRKHEIIQTGLSDKELSKANVKELLHMFTMMTGFQPTAKMKKAKSEEELTELIDAFMQAKMKEEFESQSQKDEFGNDQSFTWEEEKEEPRQKKKMTQADLKRKMQEEQTLKSMRTVYMELVKKLHPDREQDEALRAVKEERMKQLTEAYQKKDLAALLTMQVSWLEETVTLTPGELSDEVLKGYNKVLRAQLKKLEEEQEMARYSMPDLSEEMADLLVIPLSKLDKEFNDFLADEQFALKEMHRISKSWCTKKGIKKLIQEQQKKGDFDDFLGDLMGDDMIEDLMRMMMSGKTKR